MRSRRLQTALTKHVDAVASYLRAEIAAGAEVPFEVSSRAARRGQPAPLYCYRALTGTFIAEREVAFERLRGHTEVTRLLEGFDGLDRYLASAGAELRGATEPDRVRAAITALLQDVFDEQTDFEVRPERLTAALDRLERSTSASAAELTLVGTLHGMTISSTELAVTKGLTIAQPDALEGVPDGVLAADEGGQATHLIVVLGGADDDSTTVESDREGAVSRGRAVLKDLLRALRLFGDGRVTLGALAWVRTGTGAWTPLALGAGGRPDGMLVVTAEQEDELRAFCNLVSRRAPDGNELAWALKRFELGCERESPYEALSDHLLALRALLEPEGSSSGLLAGRLAALCATPENRVALTERVAQAVALERAAISGTAVVHSAGRALAQSMGDHLRALLTDVICGHLAPDLTGLADQLLAAPEDSEQAPSAEPEPEPDSEHDQILLEV